MRRLTLRIAVAFLTFLIGVATASIWMVSRIAGKEEPPCRGCAELYSSSEIPTVTLCEISANPEQYRGKLVRVRAVFHNDAGAIHFFDSCGSGGTMYAGIGESCGACAGTWKALSVYSGYKTWYDSDARVAVIGRAGHIGGKNFYRDFDGFNILCLERVEPVGLGVWQRIYYTIGEAASTVF
jgi:hypothetical protein